MISLIELEPNAKEPMYQQIYRALTSQIMGGTLKEGEYLPSKRVLCDTLNVSHSTVESAYALMLAEGYIESIPRKGYRVLRILALPDETETSMAENSQHLPEDDSSNQSDDYSISRQKLSFSTSAVETASFPFDSWARLYRETLYTYPGLLEKGEGQGDLELRESLCNFLSEYRAVRCTPDQIVVGAGASYLLDLIMKLMPERKAVGVESPGYPGVFKTGHFLGRDIVPISLDDQGISVKELYTHPEVRLCFTTPSHQFPTGVTMSIGRRSELLLWARQADAYIIEDDYDSEFRYQTRPTPALQGIDTKDRVIFLGTFSRSIAPSIRIAYAVLPRPLANRYRKVFRGYDCTVSRLEQQVLSRFLNSGGYSRHVRRTTRIYKERKEYLEKRLLDAIPGASISGSDAGLHFLLRLPGTDRETLLHKAKEEGLSLMSLPGSETVLVIGFAGIVPEKADQMVSLLAGAVRSAGQSGDTELLN